MLKIQMLHHVSIPVSAIARATRVYEGTLGLRRDPNRPDFDFEGAWYRIGDRSVHLIVPTRDEKPRLRAGKARFPHIYILDPDRNVIEINAEIED